MQIRKNSKIAKMILANATDIKGSCGRNEDVDGGPIWESVNIQILIELAKEYGINKSSVNGRYYVSTGNTYSSGETILFASIEIGLVIASLEAAEIRKGIKSKPAKRQSVRM